LIRLSKTRWVREERGAGDEENSRKSESERERDAKSSLSPARKGCAGELGVDGMIFNR